jgi:uncharacterized protein Yka (UPF0111/DUF47 family)
MKRTSILKHEAMYKRFKQLFDEHGENNDALFYLSKEYFVEYQTAERVVKAMRKMEKK